MKVLIIGVLLVGGIATGAFAQGTILVDNIDSDNPFSNATSGGLFFLEPGVTYNGSFLNITVLGGDSAAGLTPIVTLTGPNGFVYGGGPGQYADASGASYTVPGVPSQGTAFLEVEVWTGDAPTFAAAETTPGALYGNSGVFQNLTGGPAFPPAVPQDLIGMPAVLLFEAPEPSTIVLGGLGAAALMLFRRRK
jgi:hypothetical protein